VSFGDKWHLDEVVIKINGRTWWLWRAVDQHGAVLGVARAQALQTWEAVSCAQWMKNDAV
jgi:transposase-like protein